MDAGHVFLFYLCETIAAYNYFLFYEDTMKIITSCNTGVMIWSAMCLLSYIERRLCMQNIKYNSISQIHSSIMRGPYQMSIDITNKCNLRCLHCFNRSGENPCVENELSDKEIIDFLYDVVRIKPLNICFCGGEPLLRKDLLIKGITIVSDAGIKASMVTNGILMTAEIAKQLKASNVFQVQVSVDGMGESHNRLRNMEGSFDKAIQALRYLSDEGIKTAVSFAPTAWNIGDIEKVCNILKEIGVSELRCQPLMIMGRGSENKDTINPSQRQYRELVRTIHRINRELILSNAKFSIQWGDPIDHLIRFSNYFDGCCMYICVKADGGITPSIYLPITVGNIRRHKLSEYWEYGMARVWQLKKVVKMESLIRSVSEMNSGADELVPEAYKDKDIDIDFIDDLLYKEVEI